MPQFPIQSTTGDPVFRSQHSSINAIRNFSRTAADSSIKLNNQERLVSPGEDALSFSTSRRIRSDIKALKNVQETGQLNITGTSLAIEGLEAIKLQLDKVKKTLIQSQVADLSERDSLQAQIDLALGQIDSTAANTKLGSRTLLNGESSIKAYSHVSLNGGKFDFALRNAGQSLTQTSGIQNIRVNKVGAGGATKTLNDGTNVLSIRVSLLSANRAQKAFLSLGTAGAAGQFSEFRITGKLGSATLRIDSNANTLAQLGGRVDAFNRLAQETGVVLTSTAGGGSGLTTVGFGSDEFIKVEYINGTTAGGNQFLNASGNVGGAGALGESITDFGRAARVNINGYEAELGGDNGLTARYQANGFDIEIDFRTTGLAGGTAAGTGGGNSTYVTNIDLSQGLVGLLGSSGSSKDALQYGFGNFTTENLGRGAAQHTVTQASQGGELVAAATTLGNQVINQFSVAELGSGGRASLGSGNFIEGLKTIDRAISQVIGEQTRLGTLQGNFIDAVNRSEVLVGNLTSADADIIGVDAATEITNLVQAQLGVSTASSVLSQANAIQANIFSLLRG